MTTSLREALGRYQVEAEIGRGAMGVVYRGRDPKIDRPVAIKTISLAGIEGSEEQEYRERFAQEARAAGRLAHPGIVTIFDAGEDPETHEPFFVMELVAGRSLSDEIASGRGRLPLSKALQIACQVADALQYAHSKGVIHGDIKPANILITQDGHAKIADFGVARLNQSVATHAGKIFGSPAYMAPELLSGGEADARSDLFSLGVMLYSMLTGFRPFQGNSAQTVCFKVMNVEPVPVSSLRADLPMELDRIVQRAIAKDPGDRYQTGAEFVADLRAFVSNDDSFAEATRFFTRVLEQDRAAKQEPQPRQVVLTRRFLLEAAVAIVFIASLFTATEFVKTYRASATLFPDMPTVPHAPDVHKTVPWHPPIVRRSKRSVPTPAATPVQTAKVRVEILHHFPSGRASVWLDEKLVLDEELRGNTDRHPLFRAVEMNQVSKLQIAPGKHRVQVRVVSPGIYDDTESISAELTAGREHLLYVNCDKRTLQVKLQ